jgi:hypothetical protein
MAEYVLHEDDDQQEVVRELLAKTDHPGQVTWSPRPDVPHGGVYVVPEDLATEVLASRKAAREAQVQRIADAQAAADERDSHEAVAQGLATPAEAGFPASVGGDPGAPGTEDGTVKGGTFHPAVDETETEGELAEDAADDAVVDDPSTPEDEAATAQKRREARAAARKSRTTKTDAADTSDATTEEGK